jgi:hypothetical protein
LYLSCISRVFFLQVTKLGVHKPRRLMLNIADGAIALLRATELEPTKPPLSLGTLSHIEKSISDKVLFATTPLYFRFVPALLSSQLFVAQDKARAFLVFYGDFRP